MNIQIDNNIWDTELVFTAQKLETQAKILEIINNSNKIVDELYHPILEKYEYNNIYIIVEYIYVYPPNNEVGGVLTDTIYTVFINE
jgi:hypothetical protein